MTSYGPRREPGVRGIGWDSHADYTAWDCAASPEWAGTGPRAEASQARGTTPSLKSDSDTRIPVYTRPMRAHEWIDRRSLALHEAVAAKLETQPQLLEVARANLQRWLTTNPAAALREWWQLLDATPLPELVALLRSPGDQATRLRQSSPFAGLLTPAERQSILDDYESRRA